MNIILALIPIAGFCAYAYVTIANRSAKLAIERLRLAASSPALAAVGGGGASAARGDADAERAAREADRHRASTASGPSLSTPGQKTGEALDALFRAQVSTPGQKGYSTGGVGPTDFGDEDFAAIRAHLDSLPGGHFVCPLCRGTQLDYAGFVFPWVGYSVRQGTDRLDILVMGCGTCHFLCHFLWEPIVAAALRGAPVPLAPPGDDASAAPPSAAALRGAPVPLAPPRAPGTCAACGSYCGGEAFCPKCGARFT